MQLGLFARLAITLSLLLTLAMLTLGGVLLRDAEQRFNSTQLNHARSQAKILAEASLDALITVDYELLERWVISVIPENYYAYAYLAKGNGQVLTHSENSMVARYLDAMGPLEDYKIKESHYHDRPVMEVFYPAKVGDAHLANAVVAYYLDEETFFEKNIAIKIAMLLALFLLLLLAVTLFIIRKFTFPLSRLTDYISSTSISNKKFHIDEKLLTGWGEVGVLSRAFEAMIKRLLGAFEELSNEEERLKVKVEERTNELANANNELESFCSAVSHDLRTPLHSISSFSQIVVEDYEDKIDEEGKNYLNQINDSATKMEVLIDDMLQLSRVSQQDIEGEEVDISLIATEILQRLSYLEPDRKIELDIEEGITCFGDRGLLIIVMENLVNNAWKYSSKKTVAKIQLGQKQQNDGCTFFIKDNGAGFNMEHVDKLFKEFKRLHGESEFSGTGVGLATVGRVIKRHQGEIWAEAEVDKGATFYITLPKGKS
jgi:signal transduction histidine kinase